MKKLLFALPILILSTLCFSATVVYRISTNELIAIGNIDPAQFQGVDIGTATIADFKIAKSTSVILNLKMLTFNPANQSVDLKSSTQRDAISNQYNLTQDVIQILQLRAYFLAGIQLANVVNSTSVLTEIAIATNTIQSQIQAIVAKH